MSKFDDLFKDDKQEEPPTFDAFEVHGVFCCKSCYAESNNALASPSRSEIFWRCANGHENIIKGFSL